MLRIKKEVDLKELEKFGFLKTGWEPYLLNLQDTGDESVGIRITHDRIVYPISDLEMYNLGNKNESKMYDILYDLIQSGLVEKVSEEIMNKITYYKYDIVIAKCDGIMLYMVIDDKGNINYRLEDLNKNFQERVVNNNSNFEEFYKYVLERNVR